MGKRQLNGDSDEDKAALIRQVDPSVDPYDIVPAKKKLRTITSIEKEIGKNKLNPVCFQKMTKELKVLDEKQRTILEGLVNYKNIIGGI